MLSFNNDGTVLGGEPQQQEQQTIQSRPQTVSSLSSIDTTGYEQNDNTLDPNCVQQSTLHPLSMLPDPSGSSTVVTSTTAATSADASFGLTTNTTYIGGPTAARVPESEPSSSPKLTGSSTMQISSSTGVLVASTPNTNTVPEFLYQLTKMLTDNNRDIIEWSNGKC